MIVGHIGGRSQLPEIGRSLRFNSADSAYISKTPAGAADQKIGTLSLWVKRSELSVALQPLLSADKGSSYDQIGFESDNTLTLISTAGTTQVKTSAQYRDPTAWLHVVVGWDTTQATAADRVVFTVNGAVLSHAGGATYPALNRDMSFGAAVIQYLGRQATAATYLGGYMARVCLVYGSRIPASNFAYTDPNGQWRSKPAAAVKSVVDAGGTNSFMLDFNDGTSTTTLGYDFSGKGNNWTLTNFTRSAGVNDDWMEDTPTNNWCTLNPVAAASNHTISNGTLRVTNTNAIANSHIKSSQFFDIATVDKKYWEILTDTNDATHGTVGLAREDLAVTSSLSGTGGIYVTSAGGVVVNGSTVGTYTGWSDGALLAFWVDAGKLYYSVNGTAANSGNPVATGLSGVWSPAVGRGSSSAVTCTFTLNFGQRAFAYTPPTGFKALNTKNRPAGSVTTSGSFTGNAAADGPFVWLNGTPTSMTINGNAVTWGTHADKLAGGFKVRTSSASYNTAGSNTFSVAANDGVFKYNNAEGNP